MTRLALQATAMFAALNCRCWFEHIPSDDNPSDVLSRAGMEDPEVRRKCDAGEWVFRNPIVPRVSAATPYHELWATND